MKKDYWRQLDFYNPAGENANRHILVIGAGAIGSYTVFGLARLGVRHITVVDFDKVEPHNLPNQFFAEKDTLTEDIYKVTALKETVESVVKDTQITAIPMRIEAFVETDLFKSAGFYDTIVVTVDNMAVRKWIWDTLSLQCSLFVDARIGGQFANVFSILTDKGQAREVYEQSLYSDSDVPELPCSGKSIVDVSLGIAGAIVGAYRHYTKGSLVTIKTFYDFLTPQAYGMAFYKTSQDRVIHSEAEEVKI